MLVCLVLLDGSVAVEVTEQSCGLRPGRLRGTVSHGAGLVGGPSASEKSRRSSPKRHWSNGERTPAVSSVPPDS